MDESMNNYPTKNIQEEEFEDEDTEDFPESVRNEALAA